MSTVTKCIKMVNDGTADAPVTANITVVASTAYASGVHIYAPTVGGNIVVTAENGHSFTLGTITTANATFVRYELATPTVAGEVTLALKFSFAGGTASTIYVTGADVVASPILTPHFDGSYPNCAWTGTPNESTSTRTKSSLFFASGLPSALEAAGTIAMRVTGLWPGNIALAQYIWALAPAAGAATYVRMWKSGADNKVYARYYDGHNHDSASDSKAAWAAGEAHNYVVRWAGAATVDLNTDGTSAAQGAVDATAGALTKLLLGVAQDGSSGTASYIGPALISPERKSDAWVAAIQANGGQAFGNLSQLWQSFMVAGDLLIPLASDGTAYLKG
jgi:hypothetical protein